MLVTRLSAADSAFTKSWFVYKILTRKKGLKVNDLEKIIEHSSLKWLPSECSFEGKAMPYQLRAYPSPNWKHYTIILFTESSSICWSLRFIFSLTGKMKSQF